MVSHWGHVQLHLKYKRKHARYILVSKLQALAPQGPGNLRFINETCLYTYHAHKHARNAKCNVVYCCFLLILVVWTCQIATVHSCFILLRMVEKVNQANGHEDDAYWLHDWAPESSEFTWYHVRKRNNYCPYGKMMKLYWGLLWMPNLDISLGQTTCKWS